MFRNSLTALGVVLVAAGSAFTATDVAKAPARLPTRKLASS
jgi:hypothetical protein